MKIAILGTRGIPAKYGGFETFAEALASGMVKKGHQVTVYCPHYQAFKARKYRGIKLVFIVSLEVFFKARLARAISSLLYDLISLVRVAFSDCKVVYMLGYAAGPLMAIPRLTGKVVVVNPDGLEWKSARWGRFARAWLRYCEKSCTIVANSIIADAASIKRHFRKTYAAPVACIPYGADVWEPQPLPASFEHRALCYYLAVARMVPETSIPMIVRGYLKSAVGSVLLVVGPTPDAQFFSEQVAPLIDNVRVIYLGPIYDKPLLQSIRCNARALIQGHASEGTSPSLLESMGCGSPVIAIDTESNIDVLGPNDGLFFKTDDDLANHLNRFDSYSDERRRYLGQANREKIEKRYSWEAVVEQHLRVFTSCS